MIESGVDVNPSCTQYCAVHCSKQRNKAKQSKPKPNIILNPQYVCSLSIQQPRPARVSNLFLSGRYHVGTVKEQSQGKIDPGERSEMAFIQPGKKAVSSAILYPKTKEVHTKYLIRRVEWKYICPRRMLCVIRSTLAGPTLINLYR